ncbi:MAG: dihydrodipicolinate synthase family protein [Pseudomonadota bacterium]
MTATPPPGVLCPALTPFDASLKVNVPAWLRFCRWLISQGVGLAVFGTNSEANSLGTGEKAEMLQALLDDGIDPTWVMPGTGTCALPETVQLTRLAAEAGCAGALMLPPFYYKGVTDDGLYAYFSEVIQRVGDARLRVFLYHIPPISQVAIPADVIERLINDYPGTVAGIKDSGGDWDHTADLIARQWDGFRVYAGSESFLLQTLRAGGAGCISATANVNPAAIARLRQHWQESGADDRQAELDAVRQTFQQFPMIGALKATVAYFSGEAQWAVPRPPLAALSAADTQRLAGQLQELKLTMEGLG